jgi:hypothetical protein
MALIPLMQDEPCRKCGHKNTETKYQKKDDAQFVFGDHDWEHEELERLKLTCLNCGYVWYRAPLG